jgi:putative spermidine/putrescine transport system ATP-binding protein
MQAIPETPTMTRSHSVEAPAPGQPLSIEEVSVRYGDTLILDRVSLEIRQGEFLTLLGPSGSGKTSLLMAIAGFVDVAGGRIRFGTTELSALPPHRRNLGIVFQSYALFPHMSVFENVAYPLRLRKTPAGQMRERVRNALELMKMEAFAHRSVNELSGGQRQRVALARAVVFEPAILLMDEPLSALDRKLREHMQVELRRLHERLGITTIYVTHDQREALTMSDRIVVMDAGRIVQIDSPKLLYERPCCKFVADFLGISSFIPVTVAAGAARFGEYAWTLPGGEFDAVGEKGALLVLRPESLRLVPGSADGLNTVTAVVRSAIYEGDAVFVEAEAPEGVILKMRVPATQAADVPSRGAPAIIGWRPEDSILVAAENP